MEEIWKPLGRDNGYQVSNCGRFKHLNGNISTIKPHNTGYIRVKLRDRTNIALHILIAETFLPKPDPTKTIVNHIDGNKSNNHISNLEWATPSENSKWKAKPTLSKAKHSQEDLPGEYWKDVMFDGFSMKASNLGRVQFPNGYKTSGSLSADKYMCFNLPNKKSRRIHRVVCTAFHGPPPTELYVVNHIDENRQNNKPENLEWVTQQQNTIHSAKSKKYTPAHNRRSVAQYSKDKKTLLNTFSCVSEASTRTGIDRSGIQQYLSGKYGLQHFGNFHWAYL